MRIIGIDPGSRKTGFGIIDVSQNYRGQKHIAHGVLRLDVTVDIAHRVKELVSRLQDIVFEYRPTHCALEDIFVAQGLRSALLLGQARGAVLATMGMLEIPVQHFAPTKVKLALTGGGRSGKDQVSQMVQLLLAIKEPIAEDASDALAIALCCAHQSAVFTNPVLKNSRRKSPRSELEKIAKQQGKV